MTLTTGIFGDVGLPCVPPCLQPADWNPFYRARLSVCYFYPGGTMDTEKVGNAPIYVRREKVRCDVTRFPAIEVCHIRFQLLQTCTTPPVATSQANTTSASFFSARPSRSMFRLSLKSVWERMASSCAMSAASVNLAW